jgi:hypothetical protein
VLHPEAQAEIRVVVGIDFHDVDLAGAGLRDLQQHRVDDVAGFAPRRPERDKDGAFGLQNLRAEIRLADDSQTDIGAVRVHVFGCFGRC